MSFSIFHIDSYSSIKSPVSLYIGKELGSIISPFSEPLGGFLTTSSLCLVISCIAAIMPKRFETIKSMIFTVHLLKKVSLSHYQVLIRVMIIHITTNEVLKLHVLLTHIAFSWSHFLTLNREGTLHLVEDRAVGLALLELRKHPYMRQPHAYTWLSLYPKPAW